MKTPAKAEEIKTVAGGTLTATRKRKNIMVTDAKGRTALITIANVN